MHTLGLSIRLGSALLLALPFLAPAQTTINYTNGQTVDSGLASGTSYILSVASGTATEESGYAGGGELHKQGSGDLILTGTITNSGGTFLEGGLLEFTTLGPGGINFANGGGLRWASGVTTDISSQINPGFGTGLASNARFDTNGNDVTFASVLTGGGIDKDGAGTLTLAAANNFTGNLNLYGGTIAFNSAAALGSGNIAFRGGTLRWGPGVTDDISSRLVIVSTAILDTGGNNVTFASGIAREASSTAGFTKTGAGTLTFSGVFNLNDVNRVQGATVTFLAGSTNFGSSVLLNGADGSGYGFNAGSGGTLVLSGGSATFSSAVSLDGGTGLGGATGAPGTYGAPDGGAGGNGGSILITDGLANFAPGSSLSMRGGAGGVGGTSWDGSQIGNSGTNGTNGTLTLAGGTLQLSDAQWLQNTATFYGNFAFTGGTLHFTGTGSTITLGEKLITTLGGALGTGRTLEFDHAFTLGTNLTLDPGSTLTLHEGGNVTTGSTLTLNSGSTLDFYLGQASTSTLTLGSGATLIGPASGLVTFNFTDAGDFAAGTYDLIDGSSAASLVSFDLADFALGTGISGYTFSFAMNGNILQVTATLAAVPEPTTYAVLLGLAALGLAMWRRRRA